MRQHHPVARLGRRIQLHPSSHQARQPRVCMLSQRAERHFRTRMPRTRLSRQAVTLAHQRDMRRIKTIGHRRPLGCRQIEPRGALRRPRRRGATAKRNERRLDAGIMGINNEGQGIAEMVAIPTQHLLKNPAPLGHDATLLAGILTSDDKRGNRMRTVTVQRACA